MSTPGFVWFQGWNDQYGGAENECATNMRHFIQDVRKDLNAPKPPFVIAAMGQNGSKPAAGAMLTIREAQLSSGQMRVICASLTTTDHTNDTNGMC